MSHSCILIEGPSTMWTLDLSCIVGFLQLFLLCYWHLFACIILEHRPECKGLCFPFTHFLVIFIFIFILNLLFFLLHNNIFDNLFMLSINNSLLLSIELFSLFLEDFIAYGFVFWYAVRIEFTTTTHWALNKRWWIILNNFWFFLTV